MSAFSNAVAAGMASIRAFAGVSVTYRRGDASVAVVGVPGKTDLADVESRPTVLQYASADWIVRASDLVLGGLVVQPQQGDLIVRTVGDVTSTFEVMEPPFRPHDHDGLFLRVHTNLVGNP